MNPIWNYTLSTSSNVLLNLSLDVYIEVYNFKTFCEELSRRDYLEALVIGIRVEDSLQ